MTASYEVYCEKFVVALYGWLGSELDFDLAFTKISSA